MAYGNTTAGRQVEEVYVPYRLRLTTKLDGTAATRIFKGNVVVHAIGQAEGVQNAADTAAFLLVGVAADSQASDAVAEGLLEIYPRGSVLWMPTVDTNTLADVHIPAYVDYGTTGTPALVTSGTAGATAATNQIAMLGVIVAWKTGFYLVDTALMGIIHTDASLNFEIT